MNLISTFETNEYVSFVIKMEVLACKICSSAGPMENENLELCQKPRFERLESRSKMKNSNEI